MSGSVPRVAISMAVYNEERCLPLSLEALRAQTFRDFHLTVFDDGSTDGSAALLEGYANRLPLRLIRGEHLGRHFAKRASRAQAAQAPYLLVLDADIVLPPEALERMVATIEADPSIAAVSSRYRAYAGRRFGAGQAFIDDVFFESNLRPSGDCRWIVGGCVLLRRSALEGVELRADLGEDHDLSQKLRERWRLVLPQDLFATHHGVPTTLVGIVKRFDREAVRIRALLRAYPEARQWGSLVRLVPLPLCAAAVAGAVIQKPLVALAACALLAAYVLAFLVASRQVPAPLKARVEGALVFTIGNLGFGFGFLRESLRGRSPIMREPGRPG